MFLEFLIESRLFPGCSSQEVFPRIALHERYSRGLHFTRGIPKDCTSQEVFLRVALHERYSQGLHYTRGCKNSQLNYQLDEEKSIPLLMFERSSKANSYRDELQTLLLKLMNM